MMQNCNLDYLRATAASPGIARLKREGYELLRLTEGSRVVDVGCGPGIDTVPLGHMVGARGSVVGIDASPEAVAQANDAAVRDGVGVHVRHLVGNAAALPLLSGEADACYCERLLQHVSSVDAPRVVAEILRVLVPGGRFVVIDTDWATLSISAADSWLERRVVQALALSFAQPYAGRHLHALLRTAGAEGVSVQTTALQLGFEALSFLLKRPMHEGVALRYFYPSEVARFLEGLCAANDYGLFFAHVSMVTVYGRASASP